MNSIPKNLIRHEGLHLLAVVTLIGYLFMCMIPEPFLKLDNRQKKEFLKTRMRRLRRKSEELFDLDEDENELENESFSTPHQP